LTTHYPAHFLAGILTHDPGMYPRRLLLEDAREHGIPILPLDVNLSEPEYVGEVVGGGEEVVGGAGGGGRPRAAAGGRRTTPPPTRRVLGGGRTGPPGPDPPTSARYTDAEHPRY